MTIENKTDLSRRNQTDWKPDARRHGERRGCSNQPATLGADDEAIFPSITPPPIWPRVFPGL